MSFTSTLRARLQIYQSALNFAEGGAGFAMSQYNLRAHRNVIQQLSAAFLKISWRLTPRWDVINLTLHDQSALKFYEST
jgi:hypothetical protein